MTKTLYVQHGDSGDFKVSDQNKWYIIEETWEGGRIISARILDSYDTQTAAKAAMQQEIEDRQAAHAAAVALGSRGGSRNTAAQNATRAANGKRGGRPRKNPPNFEQN